MTVKIQLRRDTAANWTVANPVLASGEMGIESDTKKFKFGDGITRWNSLEYASSGSTPGPTPSQDISDSKAIAEGSIELRTVKDRFSDFLNVKDFGAIGDGVADDTVAIQTAINGGKSHLIIPAGTYKISDTLILNDVIEHISANGATIIRTTDKPIWYKRGTVSNITLYPTDQIFWRTDAISLSENDLTQLNLDDWVLVRSGDCTPNVNVNANSYMACLRRIINKSAEQAFVDSAFYRGMHLDANNYTLSVTKVILGTKVFFDGGIYTSANTEYTTALFDFLLCYAPDFTNIVIKDSGGVGIRLAHCVGGTFNSSVISNLLDDKEHGHLGYGILLAGACRGFSLNSGNICKCRHGITTGSVTTVYNNYPIAAEIPETFAALVSNCGEPEGCYFGPAYIYDCTGSGLNTNTQGYNINMKPNVAGCFDGILIRNTDTVIESGQVLNCRRSGIRFSGASSYASNNWARYCTVTGTTILNVSENGQSGEDSTIGNEAYGIINTVFRTHLTLNSTRIFGFTYGITETTYFESLEINNCEINAWMPFVEESPEQRVSTYCIKLKNGVNRTSIYNTRLNGGDYGIYLDDATREYGAANIKMRHVSFNECLTNIYPDVPLLALNEHDIPREYFIPGRYYASGNGNAFAAVSFTNGSYRVSPFYVREYIQISKIGIQIAEAGSNGAKVRIGIYADNGKGYPGELVRDFGTISAVDVGPMEIDLGYDSEFGILELYPGLYWFGAAVQGNPTKVPKLMGTTASSFTPGAKTLENALTGATGYAQIATSSLPSTFTANQEVCQVAPVIGVQIYDDNMDYMPDDPGYMYGE